MSIDLTPPTTSATPPPLPPAPPTRSSATIVAIVAMSLGGVLLLGTLVSGIGSIAWSSISRDATGSRVADTTGVSALSFDVSAGDVVVQYADVDEAMLEIAGGDRGWNLERRGDTLSLSNGRPWWAAQFGFGGGSSRATLTLPEAMVDEKLDARFDVSAGSITADGTYGVLDVEVGAGDADVSGTADELTVDVSAGEADVTIDGARTANLSIGAGEILATLTGDALDDVRVDVSAGSLVASLPDEEYAVTSDVSAGSFDNLLQTATDAPRTVDVQVSAGGVTLRPAD
jgi:hypothetical protein